MPATEKMAIKIDEFLIRHDNIKYMNGMVIKMKNLITLAPSIVALLIPFIYQHFSNNKEEKIKNSQLQIIKKTILDFFEYNNILSEKSKLTSYSRFNRSMFDFQRWLFKIQSNPNQLEAYELSNYALKIVEELSHPLHLKQDEELYKITQENIDHIYIYFDDSQFMERKEYTDVMVYKKETIEKLIKDITNYPIPH